MSSTPTPEDLTLPRILCLHGGGVTGAIFKAQFRSFLRALGDNFRFVFVDAPFFCDEGVGVAPVYSDWGPFRRWFRWLPTHDDIEPDSCIYESKVLPSPSPRPSSIVQPIQQMPDQYHHLYPAHTKTPPTS